MGCGHAGVVNIMQKAEKYRPCFCIGGFHLFNPFTRKSVSKELLDDIVMELQKYKDMKFYTCHCTGKTAFDYLSHHMNNIYYISCGETVEILIFQQIQLQFTDAYLNQNKVYSVGT